MITDLIPPTDVTLEMAEALILDSTAQIEVDKLKSTSLADLEMGVEMLQNSIALAKSKVNDVLNEKLTNVCRQGIYLIAAKERLGHTKFISWLEGCEGAPSLRTAERRMGLGANSAHVSNMPAGTTINQAYIKLGIIKRAAALTPAEQIRRDLRVIKRQIRNLAGKVSLTDRPRLATEIRAHISKCEKAAHRLEASVLKERLLDDALQEWGGTYILLGL